MMDVSTFIDNYFTSNGYELENEKSVKRILSNFWESYRSKKFLSVTSPHPISTSDQLNFQSELALVHRLYSFYDFKCRVIDPDLLINGSDVIIPALFDHRLFQRFLKHLYRVPANVASLYETIQDQNIELYIEKHADNFFDTLDDTHKNIAPIGSCLTVGREMQRNCDLPSERAISRFLDFSFSMTLDTIGLVPKFIVFQKDTIFEESVFVFDFNDEQKSW